MGEKLLLALWDVNDKFCNLKYLYFEEPPDLIKAYYGELMLNNRKQKMREQMTGVNELSNDEFFGTKNVAKKALETYHMEDIGAKYSNNITSEELRMLAAGSVTERIETITKEIEAMITQYIELSKTTLREVNNIHSEIYYLFCTAKRRITEMRRLIEPQEKLINEVKITAYHLKIYRDGELKNLHVVLDYILSLQDKIFRVEKLDRHFEAYCSHAVYNDHYYKMLKEIEFFRANIYGIKPDLEKQEPQCVVTHKIRNTDDPMQGNNMLEPV